MLDATLIQAVSAPPKEDRPSNDPDAGFAKRQGKSGSTFGYKAHVDVDEGSGVIRAVLTTPANVNDKAGRPSRLRSAACSSGGRRWNRNQSRHRPCRAADCCSQFA
jgi:IS5 family transposase